VQGVATENNRVERIPRFSMFAPSLDRWSTDSEWYVIHLLPNQACPLTIQGLTCEEDGIFHFQHDDTQPHAQSNFGAVRSDDPVA
jgi:hypothetical protein